MYKHFISVNTGAYHKEHGMECEDVALVEERNGILCAALADGASCARHARQGAELACRAAVDYLLYPGRFHRLFFETEHEDAKYQILLFIRNAVQGYIRGNDPNAVISDYGTTLIIFCVDHDGNYLCVNLGDGCVLSVGEKGASVITLPQNGPMNSTYLLSSLQFVSKASLICSKAASDAAFILSTDGNTDKLLHGLFCNPSASNELCTRDWKRTGEFLSSPEPLDDYSWLVIYPEEQDMV